MHLEGFVWALAGECLAEASACALWGAPGGGRGTRGLGFERTVHPCMAAVLLGCAGRDALGEET